MAAKEEQQWERVQQKTFTNWVNMHLGKRGTMIESLATDFKDGVKLIQLLEIISGETFGKYVQAPKMRIQEVENVGKALKFIEDHDVKLVNIGATEIVDGNVKMTLGMIWTIILRFAIAGLSEEGLSAKEGLLLWCQRKTEPYDNVKVDDFTVSWQDGLAFCALIHRHRPDLIDYDSLSSENKLDNLNLAFQIAADHLDIPKLLDAEDIVSMPRPDERSIMTYVAQMYKVFSSLDSIETAGRRVSKFVEFAKSTNELIHDYEERTTALLDNVNAKNSELESEPLGDDYTSTKAHITSFREYRRTTKRQWIAEQADLSALFSQIQAKLKSMNSPPYVPPSGLSVADVEGQFDSLAQTERKRRTDLNTNMRNILDALRQAFATPANAFYDNLQVFRAVLSSLSGELEDQLELVQGKEQELLATSEELPAIEAAEQAFLAANIEDNEYSDHTYDDLAFEFEQLKSIFHKTAQFIESQISAKAQTGVSAEQLNEFKQSFEHFDADKNGSLSRLEFKSALSGLGVISIDFDGGDKKFEAIFKEVSEGSDNVNLDQFVAYMTKITEDTVSPDQLRDSFATISGGRDYILLNDMKVAQLTEEQINYLTSTLPAYPSVEGAYDYKAWLAQQFN